MADEIRKGSNPNFAPPVEEGMIFEFEDENGDVFPAEFLGLLLHGDRRYGFFFGIDEDHPALSSGEVTVLEVVELDDEGQPAGFTMVDDESILKEVYAAFSEATKDIYRFE